MWGLIAGILSIPSRIFGGLGASLDVMVAQSVMDKMSAVFSFPGAVDLDELGEDSYVPTHVLQNAPTTRTPQ